MIVTAILFDPASGKRATVTEEFPDSGPSFTDDYTPGDGAWYVWIEGNYACDCNRRLLMARALGEPEPDPWPFPCGNTIVLESLTFDGESQEVIAGRP
jgi:hypothetical protein